MAIQCSRKVKLGFMNWGKTNGYGRRFKDQNEKGACCTSE